MTKPFTEEEKSNIAAILKRAKVLIDEDKAEAVKRGDISQSIFIANRQAQVESYFRDKGVILL